MVVFVVQRLEVFRIVCHEDGARLVTPLEQFCVTSVLTEPVFCLFDTVSPFSEKVLEDPTNVFVEQKLHTSH